MDKEIRRQAWWLLSKPTCPRWSSCPKRNLSSIFDFTPYRSAFLPRSPNMDSQQGYKTTIRQWSDRALAKPQGDTWNTWTFLETHQHSRKDTFWKKKLFYWNSSEHQIYLVLVSKNRLYIWYWWCQNQNSDWTWWGEGGWEQNLILRGKWKPVRFSGDAKPGTTKPFYKIEIYYQNLEGQSEKRRPAGRSQGRRGHSTVGTAKVQAFTCPNGIKAC